MGFRLAVSAPDTLVWAGMGADAMHARKQKAGLEPGCDPRLWALVSPMWLCDNGESWSRWALGNAPTGGCCLHLLLPGDSRSQLGLGMVWASWGRQPCHVQHRPTVMPEEAGSRDIAPGQTLGGAGPSGLPSP